MSVRFVCVCVRVCKCVCKNAPSPPYSPADAVAAVSCDPSLLLNELKPDRNPTNPPPLLLLRLLLLLLLLLLLEQELEQELVLGGLLGREAADDDGASVGVRVGDDTGLTRLVVIAGLISLFL